MAIDLNAAAAAFWIGISSGKKTRYFISFSLLSIKSGTGVPFAQGHRAGHVKNRVTAGTTRSLDFNPRALNFPAAFHSTFFTSPPEFQSGKLCFC